VIEIVLVTDFTSLRFSLIAVAMSASLLAQNPVASVSVDANQNRHPINPHIYGLSFASTSDLAVTNFTLNRNGGNAATMYNWQLNADNRGNDWYFESYADSNATPGFRGDDFITATRAANVGAEALLTIPMINYVGKVAANRSSLASFSIAKYGPQTGHDPWNANAGNGISTAAGNPNITGNDPNDANTPNSASLQQGWAQHLVGNWGLAANGGQKYYVMDNEHSIWHSTHRDVHPIGATYSEIYNDFVAYAGAVRAVDPGAIIVGPEEWGWLGQFYSGFDQQNGAGGSGSDFNQHNQTFYYPWLLQQLKSHEQSTGTRLLDVLSVHYYPQDGSYGSDDSIATQLIRNKSTRSLWDPNFVDQSWINQVGINGGKVNLIPNLKSWVNQYYPGLQVGITEYNWGDEANLNGATTQADVLGIFGREALDLATRWTVPPNPSPTYLAMQIYRNYDGKLSTFGDTSVSASVANPDGLSSFAAVRSSDGALTVMVVNKQQGSTPVTISLANFATTGAAEAWQIASASQTAITQLGNVPVANNEIATTVPSQSITLLVIPSGNTTSVPAAPTGLAATAGNGAVTLTWNAGGGATSYTVKRGAASGGPYTSIGTVTNPSPASFTDTGLTNGTTYYYVVSGTNSAGTSPNSAEVAATPAAPVSPTFSSSATANPASLAPGGTSNISVTVKETAAIGLANANVELQIFDKSGNAAATMVWSGQNFAAGQSRQYSYAWTPASSVAPGAYTVEIGVFDSAWSHDYHWNGNAATVTLTSAQVPPAAPAGLTAAAGNAQVGLSWKASSGATSYNVYRGRTSGGEKTTPIATGVKVTSFTNTGLTNGTKYFYKVAAVNASGKSGLSNEASATPLAPKSAALDVTPEARFAASALTYDASTHSYSGTVKVTNKSTSSIAGPLQLVFSNLTASVTLAGAGPSSRGPFLTLVGVNTLTAGAHASVSIRLNVPSPMTLNYTPLLFSGTF
jgi:hypothetical protein